MQVEREMSTDGERTRVKLLMSNPAKITKVEVETIRRGAKVGRNQPCPCGSNKKYKKCCWYKDREA